MPMSTMSNLNQYFTSKIPFAYKKLLIIRIADNKIQQSSNIFMPLILQINGKKKLIPQNPIEPSPPNNADKNDSNTRNTMISTIPKLYLFSMLNSGKSLKQRIFFNFAICSIDFNLIQLVMISFQKCINHLLYNLNQSQMKHTTTQFDFSAKPKVTALKPKYREREEERLDGTNLMNDPRIVRGNTYAAIVQNKNEIQPPARKQPKQLPKKKERRINFDTGFEVSTPRAVAGREHDSMQTEPFVETLRDKPIQYEKECQTDLFLDRPVERQFDPMKGKTGIDRNTQIEENDPQLFDFNYEVQPIVDALLSKVVETSRMELYEEQELKKKEEEKIQYEKRRHARLAEAQKLEANQNRLKDQTQRRQLQYKKSNQQECAAQKKVIARILSKQYLKNIKPNTELILQEQGFFRQPLQTDLFSRFTPWLYQQILNELHSQEEYRRQAENLINERERELNTESTTYIKAEKDRRAKIEQERLNEIERKRLKKEQKLKQKEEEERLKREEEERLLAQANPPQPVP